MKIRPEATHRPVSGKTFICFRNYEFDPLLPWSSPPLTLTWPWFDPLQTFVCTTFRPLENTILNWYVHWQDNGNLIFADFDSWNIPPTVSNLKKIWKKKIKVLKPNLEAAFRKWIWFELVHYRTRFRILNWNSFQKPRLLLAHPAIFYYIIKAGAAWVNGRTEWIWTVLSNSRGIKHTSKNIVQWQTFTALLVTDELPTFIFSFQIIWLVVYRIHVTRVWITSDVLEFTSNVIVKIIVGYVIERI